MNNVSERVQREFNEWKEKYEIPYHMEHHVKTLLRLQEEYDNVEASSNTTKTRETLLHMIQDLYVRLKLKEKELVKKTIPMYVDFSRVHVDLNDKIDGVKNMNMGVCIGKVNIYIEDKIIVLNKNDNLIRNYAFEIKSIINTYEELTKTKLIAYIDTQCFGNDLYDALLEFDDIKVEKLNVKTY
jgi:hypothetical protein